MRRRKFRHCRLSDKHERNAEKNRSVAGEHSITRKTRTDHRTLLLSSVSSTHGFGCGEIQNGDDGRSGPGVVKGTGHAAVTTLPAA